MDTISKLEALHPRSLRYRSHYRVYLIFMIAIAVLMVALWAFRLYLYSWHNVASHYQAELAVTLVYFIVLPFAYFIWLRPRINHSVQVFPTHILIHKGHDKEEVVFENIESITVLGLSVFYFKMKNGVKYYFNSDLERVDYIWEGVHTARKDLVPPEDYEEFRAELVKYDHHQKRKEWFFRHKLIDLINWILMPVVFLGVAWAIQSKEIIIHQQSLYFFRLFMYALLILLLTSQVYSIILKKFIFDRKFEEKKDHDAWIK